MSSYVFSCFEDDEPPCVEDIEFSNDCPPPEGADLDSDVNGNTASAEEEEEEKEEKEEEEEEGAGGGGGRRKHGRGSVGQSQQWSARGLPPPASKETPGEKRTARRGHVRS
ncbi:hypothetical protein EYF80_065853 [Liparis tanakae]|uniref:Uncharacterized protein n=1 Tax=Liparis tanakae TaxID=230148 RepID=A0A4Z2E5Z0_9TELE|nr:hypothetical protein EYF80_065853 [Liparis tanakae]